MSTTAKILIREEASRWIASRAELEPDDEARDVVGEIIAQVRAEGDEALRRFSERFDGVTLQSFEVKAAACQRAWDSISAGQREALGHARANIEVFHRTQRRSEPRIDVSPGVTVWREFRPIERVGLYVPSGRASYPSSVLMAGVPAQLAGCRDIVICVPPGANAEPPAAVLAAARLLGIERVFAVGGAQAIAALAFGTESIPRVDKIFGPGNRFVTAAKELVYGAVDIDMPAGPSEIVVLADGSARPEWIAADLLSQAEHAPDTVAVCVSTDGELAHAVGHHLDRQLSGLPNPDVARESLGRSAICIAADLEEAISWVNALAAEHLSIQTRDNDAVLGRIDNAGSVFLGPHSPVAAGDYAAGSNHILPTGRRARAWSGLSLDDFGRWVQVQKLTAAGLASVSDTVRELARWEGFEAHARAVEVRRKEVP